MEIQNGHHDETHFNIKHMGISHFSSSFWKQLFRFQPTLAEMLGRWSFTRVMKLVQFPKSTWPPGPNMYSDWSSFQTFSCKKMQSVLNCYFGGMIVQQKNCQVSHYRLHGASAFGVLLSGEMVNRLASSKE